MKTVILALLVLVVVSQGEALRCYCGGKKLCSSSTETCYGENPACIKILFHNGHSPFHSQSCVPSHICDLYKMPDAPLTASCCWTDLCNR